MNKQPDCPECEKLSKVADESNKIGDFLDVMRSQGLELCHYDEGIEMWLPERRNFNQILADYYHIDLNKVEQERSALLDWLRKQQYENKA